MTDANIHTPDWLRQMENILEEFNEGVVIVDNQIRIIFANEALTRLGQYERGEILGCTPDAIFPPQDVPSILRQHESGHLYGRHRDEFYVPRKDGEKIPAIFSARVIQGPDGQEYVLIIVTDISAQKRGSLLHLMMLRNYPREFRISALVRRSRNLLISPFKSGNRSGQVPGTSDASQTQSVLTGS
jgi:PAS domain S-box-containing protein